ncbi:MAG: phosphonate ABC transporter ATP-binding protein [Pseudomonadota bacterium]
MSAEAVNATPILELRDVEVIYPNGTQALHRLDLDIEDDCVTVLLGPSGAGKSSLLRSLNLLVKPCSGTVSVRGKGALQSSSAIREHRRDTAMVFQQHQLIGRQTALQNVLTGRLGKHSFWRTLAPLSEPERRLALSCLDRVGLFEKALTRCDSLSGGQQQRVGIARALVQEPRIILADEPVASLDPASSDRVLSLLRKICKEDRIPLIMSLHQLEYARTFADRIIGLSEGRIVFDDHPDRFDDTAYTAIYGT